MQTAFCGEGFNYQYTIYIYIYTYIFTVLLLVPCDVWQVQPAILTGTFGYAIGTPLGFFVASKILKPLSQHMVLGL